MEIKLTQQESEQYFYNALCNGLGIFQMSGIELTYHEKDYDAAKSKLIDPCYEDVLMQILKDGNTLMVEDVEGEGENNAAITIGCVHERVQQTPLKHLQAMIDEEDDAETADVILQTVFFQDIIFG